MVISKWFFLFSYLSLSTINQMLRDFQIYKNGIYILFIYNYIYIYIYFIFYTVKNLDSDTLAFQILRLSTAKNSEVYISSD